MLSGIICLDKPEGITSFSAVRAVRRITGEKKVGHAGTLDPMATGVLPVFMGAATRFIELLPDHGKSYRAGVRPGITTDTLDITGTVTGGSAPSFTKEELLAVLDSFKGKQLQLPPMYSAISKNGVRLYDLARQGIEVEREKREIEINSLELIDFNTETHEFIIDVKCSKGTYIRSLASDIGETLSCGAALYSLRRTSACGFDISSAVTIEELEKSDNPESYIIPVWQAFSEYPAIYVSPAQAKRFANGGGLSIQRLKANVNTGYYRVFSPEKVFLGIGEVTADSDEMAVKRVYTGND